VSLSASWVTMHFAISVQTIRVSGIISLTEKKSVLVFAAKVQAD
jgi:hypothetical protein